MKVIRNINNNISVCVASNGVEAIAFGKGIGFRKPPYEIELTQIERTFYDVNEAYINMLHDIPEEILEISAKVLDYTRKVLDCPVSSNMMFTLADHIQFAIKRNEENLNIRLPILYDVEHLFERETAIGRKALALIRKEMKVYLPKEEAACIALHIINAEDTGGVKGRGWNDEEIIEKLTGIIEAYFHIVIDREGFNYSRFMMHMHYLLQRGKKKELFHSEDNTLYETLLQTLPETRNCVEEISRYLQAVLDCELTSEERMYLMLHTNRLCVREDCEH